MKRSLGSASAVVAAALVEVDLLGDVVLMINCLHVLRMHSIVGVEHLLHS